MIAMLRQLPGFERLREPALELIVARAALRRYSPGQIALPSGTVGELLFACVEGSVVTPQGADGRAVFDAPGLLFGLPARGDYRAGAQGMSALAIAKPHVFTIVREFPEFVVSLLEHGETLG